MLKTKTEEINVGATKYWITKNDFAISFKEWIFQMKNSTDFVHFYTEYLRQSPYEGYFWEAKPINKNRLEDDFEFVLVESKTLSQLPAEKAPFEGYFDGEDVVTFPNLGGDAQLIVPNEISETSHYGHLAAFVRNAPEMQIVHFWKKVAEEYERLIGNDLKWLSTAGLGVYWLHARVDSRPKYYRYAPYSLMK